MIDFCLEKEDLSSAIIMERDFYQFEKRTQTKGETAELFGLNDVKTMDARLDKLEKLSLRDKQYYIFYLYADVFHSAKSDATALNQRHNTFLHTFYIKLDSMWFLSSARTCSKEGVDPYYVDKLISFKKPRESTGSITSH